MVNDIQNDVKDGDLNAILKQIVNYQSKRLYQFLDL